jgi:hypothetical protein
VSVPLAQTCCCPSFDPHECARIRYRGVSDFDYIDYYETEPCECICHDDYELADADNDP